MTTFNECADAVERVKPLLTQTIRTYESVLKAHQHPRILSAYTDALLVYDDLNVVAHKLRVLCETCKTE